MQGVIGKIYKNKNVGQLKVERLKNSTSNAVSFPTFVGKHDSSSSASHWIDYQRLYDIPEFKTLLYRDDGSTKPILWLRPDGATDVNPKNENVNAKRKLVIF